MRNIIKRTESFGFSIAIKKENTVFQDEFLSLLDSLGFKNRDLLKLLQEKKKKKRESVNLRTCQIWNSSWKGQEAKALLGVLIPL